MQAARCESVTNTAVQQPAGRTAGAQRRAPAEVVARRHPHHPPRHVPPEPSAPVDIMPAMSGYVAGVVNHLTMCCSQDLMLSGALVELAEWHGQWWHARERTWLASASSFSCAACASSREATSCACVRQESPDNI
jgi:hypothetical protein